MGELATFRRLLRDNRPFRRLWLSHLVSLLGDWLSYIAVAVIAIEKGGSGLAVAMVMVVHSLPTALIAPLAGPLADRFDRRKIILTGYISAGLVTLGMWGASLGDDIWLLQLALFLRVSVSSMGMTARSAAIPMLVAVDDLKSANALLGLTWSIMFTVGLGVGGVLSEVLTPSGAILIDVSTFFIAAAVAWRLPTLDPRADESSEQGGGFSPVWVHLRQRPRLIALILSKTSPMLANGAGWVVLNLVAGARLAPLSTAVALGVLQSVRAVGTGVGPLVPARWLPDSPLSGPLFVFIGVGLLATFESPWVAAFGVLLWGAGGGHNWVMSTAQLQSNVPPSLLGRAVSLDFFLLCIGQAIAALGAGWIIDRYGTMSWAAYSGIIAGALLWLVCLYYSSLPEPSRSDASE